MEKFDKLIHFQQQYAQLQKKHFFEDILFSYQWWFLLTSTIIIWTIWLLLVNKKRLIPILIVGFITCLLAIIMDDIGLSVAAWSYPYRLFYFSSRLTPVDMAIIPVTYMLIYQYFNKWKTYLFATAGFGLFSSIIAEPLFVHFNIYVMLRWEYWYSAPIYFIMGVFAKYVVDKLENHLNNST